MSINRTRIRTLLAGVVGVLVALATLAPTSLPGSSAAAAVRPQTVVSLTFDDANANQKTAATLLNRRNMDGTFYVPSGYVGAPGYLTLADLQALKAAGHEIGGHTLSHPDLTTLPADEVARQVCGDRAWLADQGFAVRSFAYPFASVSAEVKAVVAACGYNSARGLGDLRGVSNDCRNCAVAETLPPPDPFETRAPEQVETSWTLANLQALVSRAETRGGWVQITFHNICASGCEISVTPTVLEQFLTWLAPRAASRNTVVKTVGDVVGGAVKPVVAAPAPTPLPAGVNGVQNPSLETLDADGTPSCWMKGGYGANTATLSVASPGRTGAKAAEVAVSGYVDGDAKWLPRFDLGGCSPTVATGHTYSLRSWYTATTVTQYALYLRDEHGAWHYWTSSPWFAPETGYTQAVWTTPEIPSGMTGLSFGLNVFGNGSLVTDDYAVYDSVGAPPADAAPAPTARSAPTVSPQVEPQSPSGIQDSRAEG